MIQHLRIAGIHWQVSSEPGLTLKPAHRHHQFGIQSSKATSEKSLLQLKYVSQLTEPATGPLHVQQGGTGSYRWKVLRYADRTDLYLRDPSVSQPMRVSLNQRRPLQPILVETCNMSGETLRYPIDILILQLLALHFDLLVMHGCGFVLDGNGILGLGRSGAGKSTLAAFAKETGGSLIQDDRLFIRRIEDQWWMFPVPLSPGDKNTRFRINQLLLLHHGRKNQLTLVDKELHADRLLPHMAHFPVLPENYLYQLLLIEELSQKLPIHDLHFLPNPSCINFLKNWLRSH